MVDTSKLDLTRFKVENLKLANGECLEVVLRKNKTVYLDELIKFLNMFLTEQTKDYEVKIGLMDNEGIKDMFNYNCMARVDDYNKTLQLIVEFPQYD